MKNRKILNVLLAMGVALICIRLFRDFDPALLGATICITLYVVLGKNKKE